MRVSRFPFRSLLTVLLLPVTVMAGSASAQLSAEDADDTPLPAVSRAHLPPQELSAKVLYQLLLAEIAAQRDRLNLSVNTYLDLARSTGDPRVSQRATEVAVFARNPKAALEAARLWSQQDPDSDRARQNLSGLLVSEGKLSEARPYLEQMLSKAGPQTGPLFMNLHSLLAQHADKDAVAALVEQLAKPYPKLPEASYAVALAALDAGKIDRAKAAASEADAKRPGWESAALLYGQILQTGKDPAAVRSFYRSFLDKYPKSQDVRLIYARLLVDDKLFPAAREQFQAILKAAPDNPDFTLAVGLLSMQLQDYAAAETYLQKVLTLGYREPDTVRFYLGQLHEEQKDWAGAAQWYGQVESGDQFVLSRMRIAVMLSRQNRLQEGRDLLHSLPAENAEQRTLLAQADAQLLSDVHNYQEAWNVLSDGLTRVPDSSELLYDRAMVAEKMNRIDLLEADLRKVIALKPEHAHAYNALGYTLADRTERFSEALELIQKAVALAPGDPFIIDSLGWVQFRLGRLEDAQHTLKDAYDRQPDPEIAAHLGQVLWAQGQKDAATRLWQASYKANPDSEALRAALEQHTH
jgi:tetratricopeptide (TPR) repeat protein